MWTSTTERSAWCASTASLAFLNFIGRYLPGVVKEALIRKIYVVLDPDKLGWVDV